MSTLLVISLMVFVLIKASMLVEQTQFPIRQWAEFQKIHATDKLLENINVKMDNFTVAT
jgi:hypothetical protein